VGGCVWMAGLSQQLAKINESNGEGIKVCCRLPMLLLYARPWRYILQAPQAKKAQREDLSLSLALLLLIPRL